MQKIVPHLWYDNSAKEAATFYVSLFNNSKLVNSIILPDTPSGDAELVYFILENQLFNSISAGPYFKFNPSVSLMVYLDTKEEITQKWQALIEGGSELMPLAEYPFNPYYGWLEDKYGLSWQLMLADKKGITQKIVPNLLFSNKACGRAEEAVNFYAQVFKSAKINMLNRYKDGEAQTTKAKINYADFELEKLSISAMDNGFDVDYSFNEAFSFIINCQDNEEIDYYWKKLSAVPEDGQCGWIKDKFGVSWQIVPAKLDEIMTNCSKEELLRVVKVILKMKKLDLAEIEKALIG